MLSQPSPLSRESLGLKANIDIRYIKSVTYRWMLSHGRRLYRFKSIPLHRIVLRVIDGGGSRSSSLYAAAITAGSIFDTVIFLKSFGARRDTRSPTVGINQLLE
jgi:hypothetical protein